MRLRRPLHHGGGDLRRRDPPQQPVAADLDPARQRRACGGPRPPAAGRRPARGRGSMWAAWVVEPHQASRMWAEGFVVLLAGAASSAFAALIDTVAELRRTRAGARARRGRGGAGAVLPRPARPAGPHALGDGGQGPGGTPARGHRPRRRRRATRPTSSRSDAAPSATYARRSTRCGRRPWPASSTRYAVRSTPRASRRPSTGPPEHPSGKADEVLAWVLREGATNVMRHSGASACRIELVEREGPAGAHHRRRRRRHPDPRRRSASAGWPACVIGSPRPGASSSSSGPATGSGWSRRSPPGAACRMIRRAARRGPGDDARRARRTARPGGRHRGRRPGRGRVRDRAARPWTLDARRRPARHRAARRSGLDAAAELAEGCRTAGS